MITDFEIWTRDNPAPASVMIISDEVASSKSRSKIICLKLQKFNYNCFLAYSVRPSETPLLVTSAEWLWESLLAGVCSLIFHYINHQTDYYAELFVFLSQFQR